MEKHTGIIIYLTLIFMVSFSIGSFGSGSWNVDLVSKIGGNCYTVAVQSTFAYIAYRDELHILNISNPASPQLVGVLALPTEGNKVVVNGAYAYIAVGWSGLIIADISDPANPVEVGQYTIAGWADDIAVSGNYVYLADLVYGLRIIDVSNPSSPNEVKFIGTSDSAIGIAVQGQYAYLLDWGYGLRVIDIHNPVNAWQVGYCALGGG
ncbi:MAG: LVIVD repeat-containing protein [bacterium]